MAEDKPTEFPAEISPAQKLKEENDLYEKEIARKEQLDARSKAGGGTVGNQPQIQETPEQLKKKGAMEFFKDTAIEKAIQKHG